MASFFVRNNTSGGSFKSISGAMSRIEASDFSWLSNQFDDRCCRSAKTCVAIEWKLLCFCYMCQFSSSSATQDSFMWKYFSVMGGDHSGKRGIIRKGRDKISQTCFSNWKLWQGVRVSKFQFDPEPEGHRFVSPRLLSVTLVKQSWLIDWLIESVMWAKEHSNLKKETKEIISPSNPASCLLQWLYGELCGCCEQIFVAPNKVVFSASYSLWTS